MRKKLTFFVFTLIALSAFLHISCDSDNSSGNDNTPPQHNDETLRKNLVGEWHTYHKLSKHSQTVSFLENGSGSLTDTIFYGDTTVNTDPFTWTVENNVLTVTGLISYRLNVVIDEGRLIARYASNGELWDFYVNTAKTLYETPKNVSLTIPSNWHSEGPSAYFIFRAYRHPEGEESHVDFNIERESARGYNLSGFYPLAFEWWKKTVERGTVTNVKVISETDVTVNQNSAKEWHYSYSYDTGSPAYKRKGVHRMIVKDGMAYHLSLKADEKVFSNSLAEFNNMCSTLTFTDIN